MANALSGISWESALGDSIRNKNNAASILGTQNTSSSATTSTTATTSSSATSTSSSTATSLTQRIANDQATIDEASAVQTENDKTIEELEEEIDELKEQIVNNMEKALNEGKDFTEEQETNINNAVTQTVAAYLKGEISKDELMETLATKLSASDSEMADALSDLIDGNDAIVDKIDTKISKICDLAAENDELAKKIKTAAADLDAAQKEQAAASTDPIGFEQDDATYDFIVDRDNDGEFDGANEFLGAENGFEEMEALDTDGNGIVEGDELNGVQMVKTDKKTNTQTFVTAQEAGVTSIDLSTYKAKNEKLANGNTLAGNYNLNVNGESVEGYQTLDKNDWLTSNYGNLYGQSINSDATYSQTSNTENEEVAKVATTDSNHISLKDVKNLNSLDEQILINQTTVDIDNMLDNGMTNNATSIEDANNDLISEEERDHELGINQENSDNTETQEKPTTQTFMAMAYACQVQDENAKKKVAA